MSRPVNWLAFFETLDAACTALRATGKRCTRCKLRRDGAELARNDIEADHFTAELARRFLHEASSSKAPFPSGYDAAMRWWATSDGVCVCGHVLDRSTDEACRHCRRRDKRRADMVALLASHAKSSPGLICTCKTFEPNFADDTRCEKCLCARPSPVSA